MPTVEKYRYWLSIQLIAQNEIVINYHSVQKQVERREDEEQNVKEQEIFDILVAAGYFRARIKGLSPFDKIVGGMTWCIVSCDYDVDVDLLFHENLTIGQKMYVNMITAILILTCDLSLSQNADREDCIGFAENELPISYRAASDSRPRFHTHLSCYPMARKEIGKLIGRVPKMGGTIVDSCLFFFQVENRAEKAEKLKLFALGQFHNHFSLKSDRDSRNRYLNSLSCVKDVQVPE